MTKEEGKRQEGIGIRNPVFSKNRVSVLLAAK